MATVLFTVVGTLLAGPVGGALGALAGSQVDAAIMGGPSFEGPRLKDLAVTSSRYGDAVPRHFGQMRVAGSVIWATDLVEHASSTGGKGKPKVTTYSYSSSLAVALSSRPIIGIGRIWADGNLLRGAAGDLKVGGSMRLYHGGFDQAPDPLVAGAEGAGRCPAFRGLAYAVFEDLQLADYGNRIPTLTFEVFADDAPVTLASLFEGVVDRVDAHVPLDGVAGYSCDSALNSTLAQFQPVFPMECDVDGSALVIARARLQRAPIKLGEPAVAEGKGDFGARSGFTRKRAPAAQNPAGMLRYYEIDRDYQPGTQMAPGQTMPGRPRTIELPAAMRADDALRLVAQTARAAGWAKERLAWRCTELDPAVAPGAIVSAPGLAGRWRVNDWEWRPSGVDLSLERVTAATNSDVAAMAGRANLAADHAAAPSLLQAFELPWDGAGNADTPALFAAATSVGAGWSGAALYADPGDGTLTDLGTSARVACVMGVAAAAIPGAHPGLIDRSSAVEVMLEAESMALSPATTGQLANGANRALLGGELIQFGMAEAQGHGRWRLTQLLRGRGGTEAAITSHGAGERFVLLNGAPVTLDAALVGPGAAKRIAAIGLGDPVAVESAIACRGLTLRPLAPVRARATIPAGGGIVLGWTRRARGAWLWRDGVDVPLQEQVESYLVSYGPVLAPIRQWQVSVPSLILDAGELAALRAAAPTGAFIVRQLGTYALSDGLQLTVGS